MIYESKSPRYSARNRAGKAVAFQAGLRVNEDGDPFGVFDTAFHGAHLGSEQEAVAFIEGLPAFQTRKVGEMGIWRRSEREESERGQAVESGRKNTVADMTEPTLRGILAANNLPVPVTASIEVLRGMVLEVLSGRTPSPESAVQSPESPEPEKPAKAKKAK